ncbi:MAG: hypothetical protein CL846_09495 [Crocinitomicaceae bacterium]|nr:hypothetical protein [Crocinitomicaceae bacterium]|tara:strand:+ start:956 stop:1213 length:258 start_codon:yes stop_codon:yes gene_type:complete
MKLVVQIDVQNAEEVVKAHKGQIMGMISDFMISKDKVKYKVERAIYEKVVDKISEELPKALNDEFISAKIKLEIIDDKNYTLKEI